jgi:hypothetical protein
MPIPANFSKNYAWNGIIAYPLMPAAGQTVNGERFIIPRAAKSLTIHLNPDSAGATFSLQTLSPNIAADGTETWHTIKVLQLEAAADAYPALDSIPEQSAVVLNWTQFGAGILRLVSAADESAAPFNIPVVFGF